MINNYNKGGLKMIDIRNCNTSLKVKWLQGYLDSDNKGKWKVFFDYHLKRYSGKLLILGNLKQRDAKQLLYTRSVCEGGYRVMDHYKLL